MSMDVYVILRDGDGLTADRMVCWSNQLSSAESIALQMEWQDYNDQVAKGPGSVRILSPEETEYRKYTVHYVPPSG